MKTTIYQGIVVDVTDQTITLLCDDGTFKNVPRSKSDVPKLGDTYSHVEKQQRGFKDWKYITLVSMFVLAIIGGYLSAFIQEDSYLYAIDINPSIEIYTNDELQVTSMEALNEDGEKVVATISYKDKHVDAVLDEVIDRAVKEKYLTNEEKGLVSLTVVSLQDKLVVDDQQVETALHESLQKHALTADVSVKKATMELVEQSEQADLSVNKYQVYEQLKQDGIDVSMDELRDKSIPTILKEVNKNQKTSNKSQENANPNAKNNNSKQPNVENKKVESEHPKGNTPASDSKDKGQSSNGQNGRGNSPNNEPVNNQEERGNSNQQDKQKDNGNQQNQGRNQDNNKRNNDNGNANQSERSNNVNKKANNQQGNNGTNSNANTNNNAQNKGTDGNSNGNI